MDANSLHCFRLAYESRSISKAARQAFLTRQGMSQVLKGLETDLGRTLFVRTPQGLDPTTTADLVYPKAVDLLDSYDAIRAICSAERPSRKPIRMSVSLGALDSLPLDRLVEEFRTGHPEMRLELDIIEPIIAERCVEEGSEDMALIVGNLRGSRTRCTRLCDIPLYAAVHKSLLPQKEHHTLDSLDGLTWYGLSKDFPLDEAITELARKRGLNLTMSFDWHDYHLILDQVRRRKGACAVPRHRIRTFCTDGIAAIPLDDASCTWAVNALTPRNRPLPDATRTVLDWLAERLQSET
ncbi:LysR family transcriptional regulator [Gordonibacter sp. An230]|uniref:LysR family transcriptional regulator n=1 Tax=Gordonibacter sp. An230 TaxID=1965592 RepID=UPI0013A6823C|nr:LysR family transcriptional regulator [Gordonibacter sp. An230]